MAHWNANGLVENPRQKKRGVLIRRKSGMIENEEVEESEKKQKVKIKPDSLYTYEELNKISEITNTLRAIRSNIGKQHSSHIVSKWLEIKLRPFLQDSILFKQFNLCKIYIKDTEFHRNYVSIDITLAFYEDNYNYQRGAMSTEIKVGLYEMFGNCSTIVINKLSGNSIRDRARDAYMQVPEYEKLDLASEVFVTGYMKILEELCEIAGYSVAFYSASLSETNKFVNKYLAKNWKNLKGFKNKRNSNEIIYYSKDL